MKKRIKDLLFKLNEGVFERNEVISLALLSALAGESIFLLGPPGVAKSLVARKLKHAFKHSQSFEYLMSRFSTPDEIFGPVSISKLKDQDKYERMIENYLPSATVVFLDEIWKAGPSIQNALLTVVNEKIFRNGDKEIKLPMKALISASNELPAKGEGLEALWDRFLIRIITTGIKDKQLFNSMISDNTRSESHVEESLQISTQEHEQWAKEIDKVILTNDVFEVIHAIRNYINEYNSSNDGDAIYISDRRWKKIIRLLRACAFFNERKEVDVIDCLLIKHCIWNEVEHIQHTDRFVEESIKKFGHIAMLNVSQIKKEIFDFEQDIKKNTVVKQTNQGDHLFIEDNCYYIEGYPGRPKISVEVFEQLKISKKDTPIHVELTIGAQRGDWGPIPARVDKPDHIILDYRNEYALTKVQGTQSVETTQTPSADMIKHWNIEHEKLLKKIEKMKAQIVPRKKEKEENIFFDLINTGLDDSIDNSKRQMMELTVELNSIRFTYENNK